jgi:ectonucleotide pyrophosphatase/phosphodiesterase family member 5
MRRWIQWLAVGALAVYLSGCVYAARHAYRLANGEGGHHHHRRADQAAALPVAAPTPLILISIDGFRADYLNRGLTPNLKALADGGARAERMTPSFPSLTFPNHYTLVTGLVPDHHGIVNNTFEDPALPGGKFYTSNHAAVTDRLAWDGATPIWVTAEQAGIRTGTEFWPGSEADIGGVRPSLYSTYDKTVTGDQRVAKLLSWLDLPAAQRPQFLTLYFDIVDTAGHDYGPDSPQVNAALAKVDGWIGQLEAGLKARGIVANQVIVADHGMAATPNDHRIYLDDFPDPTSFRIVTEDALAGLVPASDAAAAKLVGPHPHSVCYRKAQIPAHYQYGTHPRIPPIVCIAETGWLFTTHEKEAKRKKPLLGEHGYDQTDPLMGALFVANGPKFLPGVVLKPFPNTDVYGLLARLLDLSPLPNDGHVEDLYPALR